MNRVVMSEEQILGIFTEIARDILDMPALVVTPEMVASDVERWDSLNHIYIIVAVEKRFNIKVNTSEVEDLKNAGELVRLVSRKLSSSAS